MGYIIGVTSATHVFPGLSYTSPITNISSICKTININSIQLRSRNEATQQHCKHENDSVLHWYVFGGGDVWKNPRGDQGILSYPPPRMLRISRNFSGKDFLLRLPSSPRPKKWVFYVSFYGVFLVLLVVSRTARCDAYHISLPSTGDFISLSPRATWLWQHTRSKKNEKKCKKREVMGMPRIELRTWDSKSIILDYNVR